MKNDEFASAIDDYFAQCAANGDFPDEAGMIRALGLTRGEFNRLLRSGSGKGRALQDARLRRESLLTRELYATDKAATGKIFLARQPSFGALSDKPQVADESMTVEVRLTGAAAAFE